MKNNYKIPDWHRDGLQPHHFKIHGPIKLKEPHFHNWGWGIILRASYQQFTSATQAQGGETVKYRSGCCKDVLLHGLFLESFNFIKISQAMYKDELTSHFWSYVCDVRRDAHTHTIKVTTGMSTQEKKYTITL